MNPGTKPELAVLGAINIDLVLPVDAIPLPGETVLGGGLSRFGGGKGANAAVAAARAGANVSLVGAVGSDEYGPLALEELRAEGIACGFVEVNLDDSTGVALILVAPGGENIVAVAPGANACLSPKAVRKAFVDLLPGPACVLASTEVPVEAVLAAAEHARSAGVTFLLNAAPVRVGLEAALAYGPVVILNRSECAQLATLVGGGGVDIERNASSITAATGSSVVVTLGAEGVLVVTPGAEPLPIRTGAIPAVDTTGAGDTFSGVFAARVAMGDRLDDAAATATVAASLSVRAWGARTGMPTAEEIVAASGF
jgi:ribokinase